MAGFGTGASDVAFLHLKNYLHVCTNDVVESPYRSATGFLLSYMAVALCWGDGYQRPGRVIVCARSVGFVYLYGALLAL